MGLGGHPIKAIPTMRLATQSIFIRLGVIIVTTVIVIMSLHSTYTYLNKKEKILQEIRSVAQESLRSLEKSVAGFVASYAVNEYQKLISTEMERKKHFAIIVEDYNMGKVMGQQSYVTGKIRGQDAIVVDYDLKDLNQQARLQACCYLDQKEITAKEGESLGQISVYISYEQVDDVLNETIVSTLLNAVVISLLHVLTLFSAIHLFVLTPLVRITKTVRDRDERGIPLQLISNSGPQEVMELSDTINEMVVKLRKSYIELEETQVWLMEHRASLEQTVEQRTEALVKANKAKDEFLASMSHELRTPLTAIIGNSELLLNGDFCGSADCMHVDGIPIVESIHIAGKSQLALVNDILDMSKIESGKFDIDDAPYDLQQLLSTLNLMFSKQAKEVDLVLNVEQCNREDMLLLGDAQRITQILNNLVSNALKFTKSGEVVVKSTVDGAHLIFTVRDSGIGMSDEVLERLFTRFEQADSSISRRFGGSGLGLFISKNLTELMGGEIEVSSVEGVGSTFTVTLPYKKTAIPVKRVPEKVKQQSVPNEGLTGHVLVAEDTPLLQKLLQAMLEKMGVTVTIAENGQEAVTKMMQQSFDLILMDMQMPVVSGIEATRQLREAGYETPIIAVTANVLQKHKTAFEEAGCNGFIGKPFEEKDLQEVLNLYLQKGK